MTRRPRQVSTFVVSALDGYNVSLFAYGQTGSGKTHTVLGGADEREAASAGRCNWEAVFNLAQPLRRRKIGRRYLCRRNFQGGFYGASEIFLTARKTTA